MKATPATPGMPCPALAWHGMSFIRPTHLKASASSGVKVELQQTTAGDNLKLFQSFMPVESVSERECLVYCAQPQRRHTHTHTVTHNKRDATIRGMLTMKPTSSPQSRLRPAQPALGLCECFHYLTFALSNNAYTAASLPSPSSSCSVVVASLVHADRSWAGWPRSSLPAGLMCQFDCSLC